MRLGSTLVPSWAFPDGLPYWSSLYWSACISCTAPFCPVHVGHDEGHWHGVFLTGLRHWPGRPTLHLYSSLDKFYYDPSQVRIFGVSTSTLPGFPSIYKNCGHWLLKTAPNLSPSANNCPCLRSGCFIPSLGSLSGTPLQLVFFPGPGRESEKMRCQEPKFKEAPTLGAMQVQWSYWNGLLRHGWCPFCFSISQRIKAKPPELTPACFLAVSLATLTMHVNFTCMHPEHLKSPKCAVLWQTGQPSWRAGSSSLPWNFSSSLENSHSLFKTQHDPAVTFYGKLFRIHWTN